jgi:DNA repair exonuclease SbcCD ATPase subunit
MVPDLPSEVLQDLTEDDWRAINEIGEELADSEATNAKPQDEQQTPEDSTEEKETSQTEEKSEPFMQFNSKDEAQKWLDEQLKERLERKDRQAAEAKAKAEREAAKKALEDQEKYQELYTAENQRVQELEEKLGNYESLEEKHSTYVETVEQIANQRMESLRLPKGVKTLVENMEPASRLQWMQENEEDFSGSTETIPASPNGDDPTTTTEQDEKARQESAAYTASTF